MRKLLLQLDTSTHPSVFDRVVAYDAGADEVMSYGGVTEAAVRDLVHGCIFTRGPKDLNNTAIFIGGTDMGAGERVLAAVKKAFFGPMRVSVMLDSNGANTTAVAAVVKIRKAAGGLSGKRAVVTAGSGPVGSRAAGLMAKAGSEVVVTTRRAGGAVASQIRQRFGGNVHEVTMADATFASKALERAELLLNAGPAGVTLVPKFAWQGRAGLRVAVDVNAVPPLGIDGIDVSDNGADRGGITTFGALGIGGLKMKIHRVCIAKLFEKNDVILDVETISEIASKL
ncbi:MAG TPA: NAD(P)-dependent methylenetetrahydromethanopterin dehydrogenase [Vicinamibacterales bacterium]|nr:NAD(P)-dependent methylenetetrahydromethanopterin dehydrogenase [Vicinamibacterales bacterium]